MDCVSIYKCLADETRLRILNLLRSGPLCVCHVQAALELTQSNVSKQLSHLKRHGLLRSRRHNNWTIYELAPDASPIASSNLQQLSSTCFRQSPYREDAQRLGKIDTSVACQPQPIATCCDAETTC
ncbi:metalloregulator ArsR/SmtB family transcription factor [Pelagicoccus sp. SDUM812003]|nr:metalloregulator ArsR/SmtB family transcription factor [Pelagicoccus sp. SDUM812003]